MSASDRDAGDVDALLADRYLETLLSRHGSDSTPADGRLDPALRAAADRLRRDLVRVHPSFRFEERLAARLAAAAVALQVPAAAGAEGTMLPFAPGSGFAGRDPLADDDPLAFDDPDDRRAARPLLIGGALTSAALSLAGAAFVAWRRARPGRSISPMARAARLVRDGRRAAAHAGRLD